MQIFFTLEEGKVALTDRAARDAVLLTAGTNLDRAQRQEHRDAILKDLNRDLALAMCWVGLEIEEDWIHRSMLMPKEEEPIVLAARIYYYMHSFIKWHVRKREGISKPGFDSSKIWLVGAVLHYSKLKEVLHSHIDYV